MTTDTVTERTTEPAAAPVRRNRRVMIALVVIVLLAGALAWSKWSEMRSDIRYGTAVVSQDELAARQGIDVNLVAVTAAGGLIEFRYQVVDPDKAARIVHDPALAPALVVEKTGETLVMNSPPHHHGAELRLGGTYFFLMANAHNAVHQGTKLTLVIGDLRVEHLTAQG